MLVPQICLCLQNCKMFFSRWKVEEFASETNFDSRVELQAATLSVKMYRVLVDELTYKISKAKFWSDSQTAMQYIKNESRRFQTYVATRVAEIREVTSPHQWRHCPGKVNPADDASRGLKPPKLFCQHRWWRGPEFPWEPEKCWSGVVMYGEVPDSDPKVRISANVYPISVETRRIGTPTECSGNDNASEDSHAGLSRLIESCSSWITLQRRVTWIVRFCRCVADKRIAGSTGPLTLEELNQSTEVIVRCLQNEAFLKMSRK